MSGFNKIFCTYNQGINKTGLQPVSRSVERVHYLGGWSRGSRAWKKIAKKPVERKKNAKHFRKILIENFEQKT